MLKNNLRHLSTTTPLTLSKVAVFDGIPEFRQFRQTLRKQNLTHAFVPTMGCLHKGHLDLVRIAKQKADTVSVSIFVNPAQFAPHEDLKSYPRQLHEDLEMLASMNVDAVLIPPVATIYPSGIPLEVSKQTGAFVDVLGISHQLEGSIRPHFFRGVTTVVSKLFNIVQPDIAVFGQKDVQQCVVIKKLVDDLFFPVEIVVGDTVREDSGLAMSSRNRYLTEEQRNFTAPILYASLSAARNQFDSGHKTKTEIIGAFEAAMHGKTGFTLEYISLNDPKTLASLDVVGPSGAIMSAAIKVGNTRLIDNILLGCKL